MLSVVIPALDAAATLPACLAAVAEAEEIIVVDGGSSDATAALAAAAGARVIVSPRGRGVQLAAGADAARGDWLLFLHADTVLGGRWRDAAEAHILRMPEKAGCFRLRLDSPAWQARLIERGVAARAALLGLPYGDQGLLVSRRLYDAVGGYAPLPLMEDVDLVCRIGRKRLALLEAHARTSAQRWQRGGWLSRSTRNLLCLGLYLIGTPPERISAFYSAGES